MAGEEVIKRLRTLHRQENGKSDSVRSPLGSNDVKYNTWFYGRPVQGDQFMW